MDTGDVAVTEQFNKLPRKLKEMLFSEDMTDRIFTVGKENKLTMPQMEYLSDEINLLVLGATKPSVFADNIRQHLSLDQQTAVSIAKSVNEKIIAPMHDALAAYHGSPTFALAIPNQDTTLSAPPPVAQKDETATLTKQSEIAGTPIQPPSPLKSIILEEPKKAPGLSPLLVKQPSAPSPQDPYRESVNADMATNVAQIPKQRIVSWENISPDHVREPIAAPDAKSALERALNSEPPPIAIPKPATDIKAKYQNADPYREPLE